MKIVRSFLRNGQLAAVYDEEFSYPTKRPVCVDSILQDVADRRGYPVERILGPSRQFRIVRVRHEFFYLATVALKGTYRGAGWIGRRYGFDHTSVLYGAARHAEESGLKNPTGIDLTEKRRRDRSRYLEVAA
jgi:chromosomal replication initiation ATPase DnaA